MGKQFVKLVGRTIMYPVVHIAKIFEGIYIIALAGFQ